MESKNKTKQTNKQKTELVLNKNYFDILEPSRSAIPVLLSYRLSYVYRRCESAGQSTVNPRNVVQMLRKASRAPKLLGFPRGQVVPQKIVMTVIWHNISTDIFETTILDI